MSEKRQNFIQNHDWIRRALMFEPRGHDMMSGCILYPPIHDTSDMSLLFIETTGCLPMCGHVTIGTVTVLLEQGLVVPKTPGRLTLDVPAGTIVVDYTMAGDEVTDVTFHNVPSFLAYSDICVVCPALGELQLDIAYGGNFYAIIDPQENYAGLEDISVSDILLHSPILRDMINETVKCIHPVDPTIRGVSHILWTGKPEKENSSARNAVFYGDKAIDRSPCGTGTSARMAQWAATGLLDLGDDFIHESIIGSQFVGRVEKMTKIGGYSAIIPSIKGWAKVTGLNKIIVDDTDPYAYGFQVI